MNFNDLQPFQKCLIYNALRYFKENANSIYLENAAAFAHPTVMKHFTAFTEKEVIQLMHTLFADTFIDELEFVKHFNREFTPTPPPAINNYSEKPAIA